MKEYDWDELKSLAKNSPYTDASIPKAIFTLMKRIEELECKIHKLDMSRFPWGKKND